MNRNILLLILLFFSFGCKQNWKRNIYYYEYSNSNPFDIRSIEIIGDTVILNSLNSNRLILERINDPKKYALKEYILSSDTSIAINGAMKYRFYDTILYFYNKNIGDSFTIFNGAINNKNTDFCDTTLYKTNCEIKGKGTYLNFDYFDCACKSYSVQRIYSRDYKVSELIGINDGLNIWELKWEGHYWIEPISGIALKSFPMKDELNYMFYKYDSTNIRNSSYSRRFYKRHRKMYNKFISKD